MNLTKLIDFVTPLYEKKDTMHDLTHIQRVLDSCSDLMDKGDYSVDINLLVYAAYFHGIIYTYEREITNWLQSEHLTQEKIESIKRVALESQKNYLPTSLEAKILHDAHMIEGGETFLIVKSLVTGSARGQTLNQTLSYLENYILNKGECYLPHAISIYASQQRFAKQFLKTLNASLHPITVKKMNFEHASHLVIAFEKQGWHKPIELFHRYLQEQKEDSLFAFVALYENHVAGYVTLKRVATVGPFVNLNIPEVIDLNVLIPYQRMGVGTALLDEVERVAQTFSTTISLAVGLHAGYGSAQRMYIKRGYLFDGSGVWYQNKPLVPYEHAVNDDDLVLYLSKTLQ